MAITTNLVDSLTKLVYTSSNDSAVTFMSLCNHGTVTRTVDIHLVPDGDSPTASNLIISQLDILADDTYIIYQGGEKIILSNNDTIQVVASAINDVTAVVSHVQV